MYVLPESLTYQERQMSALEQDAAELDGLSLTSAVYSTNSAASASAIVAIVMPSLAAFHFYQCIYTTRDDLTKDPKVSPSSWKKYGFLRVSVDGIMTPAPEKIASRSELEARTTMAVERIPELNVSTSPSELVGGGQQVVVRGLLYLPVVGGFVIEAPTMIRPNSPTVASGTVIAGASTSGNGSTIRINVLHHPVVDDLCSLGVIPPSSDSAGEGRGNAEEHTILVCSQPGTHSRTDGSVCRAYHVAVESRFIGEVKGTVGVAYESRIRQV